MLGRDIIFMGFGCERLMMQVNFTEADVIGKETSERRRESKFGKGEGICVERRSPRQIIISPFPQLH